MSEIECRTQPMVSATDLVVRRSGRLVLDHLTFAVLPGQVTGLLGPSGCGKTTLLRTLAGVQVISGGRAELLGLPAGDRRLRHRIGYATQEPAVYEDLTLAENLRYFGTVLGLSRSARAKAIASTAADTGLSGLENRLVGTFSGGELARVGLAVALLGNPDLLILDEPLVLPQLLLCGLVVPRAQMTDVLRWLSDVLPMSYAVDAMQRIAAGASWSAAVTADIGIILAFTFGALAGGALTLRRQAN